MRGECLWVASWIALLQGDHNRAEQFLNELSVLADELDDPGLVAHLHHWGALLAMFSGDLDSAMRGFQAAVDGHRAHGNCYLELTARYMLACALAIDGHAEWALQLAAKPQRCASNMANETHTRIPTMRPESPLDAGPAG